MNIVELENKGTDYELFYLKDQLKDFIYCRSDEAYAMGETVRDTLGSINDLEKRKYFLKEKFL